MEQLNVRDYVSWDGPYYRFYGTVSGFLGDCVRVCRSGKVISVPRNQLTKEW